MNKNRRTTENRFKIAILMMVVIMFLSLNVYAQENGETASDVLFKEHEQAIQRSNQHFRNLNQEISSTEQRVIAASKKTESELNRETRRTENKSRRLQRQSWEAVRRNLRPF